MRRTLVVLATAVLAGAAACSSSGGTPAAIGPTDTSSPLPYTVDTSVPDATYTFQPPPTDGGSYNNADEILAALQNASAPCTAPESEDTSLIDAVSLEQCAGSDATAALDTEIAVFGKHSDVLDYASANWVTGDPATVVVAGVNWAVQAPPDYAQQIEKALGGTLYTADPEASPSHSGPPAPEQVTYHCTGHAPDGVDITYGPSGSQHSASRLPFTRTDKLDDSAQYYATSAQLQGAGSVSCTTTVQSDNLDGSPDVVSNSGSADGGYNIASAQVCSGIDGWEKC